MVGSPLGAFMPLPLAMMIPFMATQSMVMGDAFGRAFQYGKRKISAMSNEEFNATSMEQQASEMFAAYKHIIPELRESILDSKELQKFIIIQLLDMPRDLLASLFNIENLTGTVNPEGDPAGTAFDPSGKGRPTTADRTDPNSAAQQAGTKFQPPALSLDNQKKLIIFYEDLIKKLTQKIERSIMSIGGARTVSKFRSGQKPYNDSRYKGIQSMYVAIAQQEGFLYRVRRGLKPF